MNDQLASICLKSGVGLLGAAVATNDLSQMYAVVDPHVTFWSRVFGMVLCVCSIVAVLITIRRRWNDPNFSDRKDE